MNPLHAAILAVIVYQVVTYVHRAPATAQVAQADLTALSDYRAPLPSPDPPSTCPLLLAGPTQAEHKLAATQ